MKLRFTKSLWSRFLLVFSLSVVISPTYRCEIDHGLGISDSRIRGNIILPDMSERPDYFEAVRIVALTKQLDAEEITLNDIVFSNYSVDLSTEQPAYDLPAPLSRYEFIGAVWKERGKGWDYTKIFGFYGFDPDSFQFDMQPVVLTKQDPIAENIDIVCDWLFVSSSDENELE